MYYYVLRDDTETTTNRLVGLRKGGFRYIMAAVPRNIL